MTKYGFRLFMPLLYLLTACPLPATQTPTLSGSQIQARVQLAAEQQNTTPQPQTERFPSRVTTTPLEPPAPETVAAAEKVLQELREQNSPPSDNRPAGGGASGGAGVSGSSTSQPGFHVLSLSAAGGSQQIHIPASGSFRLTIQEGERFEILDSDARDGAARVQLPAGHFEMLLKLSNGGTLQFEDRLYHVKDMLQGNAWQRLGLRPLPVPEAWYEPDGQFVLHFTTTQVQGFQLSWQRHNTPAEPPPGLAEIGPAGGTLVLPGVATLEIPAGALSQPTVVRLRQQLEAASQRTYCFNPYDLEQCGRGWVFASPIVRIDPLELELSQPVQLELPIYEFFEKYPPTSIEPGAINMPFQPPFWSGKEYISPNPNLKKLSDIDKHNIPIWLKKFGYVTRQIKYFSSMDQFFLPFQIKQMSFEPCQAGSPIQVNITEHFYIIDNSEIACSEALENTALYLESAYNLFLSWNMKTPPKAFGVCQGRCRVNHVQRPNPRGSSRLSSRAKDSCNWSMVSVS